MVQHVKRHEKHGVIYTLFRIPFLICLVGVLAIELAAYVAVRLIIKGWEWFSFKTRTLFRPYRALYAQLEEAKDYAEFLEIAGKLDRAEGKPAGGVPSFSHVVGRVLERVVSSLSILAPSMLRSKGIDREFDRPV